MTAANAATLSGKLTQMVNGAVYSDAGGIEFIHDKKLDALEDIIEAANGKSILVAYWYKHDLTRIIDSTTGGARCPVDIGFAPTGAKTHCG